MEKIGEKLLSSLAQDLMSSKYIQTLHSSPSLVCQLWANANVTRCRTHAQKHFKRLQNKEKKERAQHQQQNTDASYGAISKGGIKPKKPLLSRRLTQSSLGNEDEKETDSTAEITLQQRYYTKQKEASPIGSPITQLNVEETLPLQQQPVNEPFPIQHHKQLELITRRTSSPLSSNSSPHIPPPILMNFPPPLMPFTCHFAHLSQLQTQLIHPSMLLHQSSQSQSQQNSAGMTATGIPNPQTFFLNTANMNTPKLLQGLSTLPQPPNRTGHPTNFLTTRVPGNFWSCLTCQSWQDIG